MVTLTKITTKTGDKGETGLADGGRVPKTHPRIEAIGAADETNSAIGVARAYLDPQKHGAIDAVLAAVQNDLFDLGADLSLPESDKPLDYEPLRMTDAQVDRLEAESDQFNADLTPLTSFVLPGGAPAAAHLHLARALCRRAERMALALDACDGETVSGPVKRYLNRLSDLLFILCRSLNNGGADDVLWTPGAGR